MSLFDDDPCESGEDRMSDALVEGCLVVIGAILVVSFLVATIVKVWL